MKKLYKFIPVFGLLLDAWTDSKYFDKWWFIVYHIYSGFIYILYHLYIVCICKNSDN